MSDATDITCFCRSMRLASKQLMTLYEAALAPSGLKIVEYAMLSDILRGENIGLAELGARFKMDRSALRYRLLPMVKGALIEISEDVEDRRGRRVRATEKGRARYVAARPLWMRAQARFAAAIGEAEAETLRATARTVGSASFAEGFGSI